MSEAPSTQHLRELAGGIRCAADAASMALAPAPTTTAPTSTGGLVSLDKKALYLHPFAAALLSASTVRRWPARSFAVRMRSGDTPWLPRVETAVRPPLLLR